MPIFHEVIRILSAFCKELSTTTKYPVRQPTSKSEPAIHKPHAPAHSTKHITTTVFACPQARSPRSKPSNEHKGDTERNCCVGLFPHCHTYMFPHTRTNNKLCHRIVVLATEQDQTRQIVTTTIPTNPLVKYLKQQTNSIHCLRTFSFAQHCTTTATRPSQWLVLNNARQHSAMQRTP